MVNGERPLVDKLGVRAGMVVGLVGIDGAIAVSIGERAVISADNNATGLDLVIVAMSSPADLEQLALLRERIVSHGALWVVWPKGRSALNENTIRSGALAIGLVDVKVVRFSDTLSALKLVIPRALR